MSDSSLLSLRLLGVGVSVSASQAVLLERYRMVFERFARPASSPADLAFRITAGDSTVRVVVEQDGERVQHAFGGEDDLFGFVYARILDQVTRRDPALLCVHAAALARGGRAIAIAAESGHGKSTLTLALAARGFTFLSDEVAAIERHSLRVRPFPMALGCRSGTARLLDGTEFGAHGFVSRGRAGKLFLCPPAIQQAPAILGAVFFLESETLSTGQPRLYRMGLQPWKPDAARRLSEIDGIVGVWLQAESGAVVVEIAPGSWVAPRVESALHAAGVLVTTVEPVDLPRPDFTAEPVLRRLRTTDGVIGLLRHLRGFGALAELSTTTTDGFGGLLAELAGRMRDVRFFRLSPGRLPALVAAIESATAGIQ